MIARVLEPELMDDLHEAIAYNGMDFSAVNNDFANLILSLCPEPRLTVLDVGTGTAKIPILLAEQRPEWQLTAIDLAPSMLEVATKNLKQAGVNNLELSLLDGKNLPFEDHSFDIIISNSLVHHLPDPMPFFHEIRRLLKFSGLVVVRDLLRPKSEAALNAMVNEISQDYDPHQRLLYRDSLHAAFTLDEVREMVEMSEFFHPQVYQSSDRHWTFVQKD